MNKKTKLAIISVVVVLVIIAACTIGIVYYFDHRVKIEETDFDPTLMNASIKPNGAALTGITIPDANDAEAQIALAVQLKNLADANLKADDKVAFAVVSNTEVLGLATGGRRYYIKNGSEYFNADYFYVPKTGMGRIAKSGRDAENTNYGYRMYYNTELGVGYEQKSIQLDYETKSNGTILFGVDWNNRLFENKIKNIPAEFSSSETPYRYYNYDWTEESLLSATVTYNAEEGYYEIVAYIDCNNEEAIEDGLKVLRDGADDPDAVYTSIKETVQIWDNGRYKTFNTYDDWYSPHIHGLLISAESANDYKTTFYYDDYSLNISNYQYATEFIDYVKSK